MRIRDFPKNALLGMLRVYQWAVSPMFPPACRFTPSCSEYATEAIECHGALRGSSMAAWRLLRCHPFARGGFDPVPVEHVHTTARITIEQSRKNKCQHWPRAAHQQH